jgi:hypothetical protein
MNREIRTHPTKIDNESFDWMVGKSIKEALFAEPGSWWFNFSGGGQCSIHGGIWRLTDAETMIVSSQDHGHQFGLPAPFDVSSIFMARINNALVKSVEIRTGAPDLLIRFDGWCTAGDPRDFLRLRMLGGARS